VEAKAKEYGTKANASRAATVQKAYIDSAAKTQPVLKALADSSKGLIDSALKYNDLMQKLPAKVSFTEFTPTEASVTLGGTITNNSDAEKSFTVKFEFVDKTGAVAASQTVNVGPVPAHQSAAFKTTAAAPSVVAFRYAPLG
jgi:hypothetical protein